MRRNAAVLAVAATGLFGLGTSPAVASGPVATARVGVAAEVRPVTNLPQGWTVTSSAGRDHLVWTAPEAVIGDAQVQFFAGDRLLGAPRPARDGRSYRLDVPAGSVARPAGLEVRAGGRRIDAAGEAALHSTRVRTQRTAAKPAALPPVAVDPGVPGRYRTSTGEYTLADVKLPDFPEPVELKAVVVAPKGATGRRPLALFLHGRHSICYGGTDGDEAWPCPAGTKPIPSYRGYLRAQRLLASQGYLTVSISANGINGQDFASDDGGAQARSSLIRLHLAHWADWAGSRAGAPPVVRQAPPADLSRVLLMGHSRGGDGVNRAAIDSLSPPPSAADGYHGPVRWKIRGTLLLAPTLFGHDPEADVPSVVVLPGCDGDVYDLQGQLSVDGTRRLGSGTALHSAAFVVGANHNFFNSEWTPGLAAAPASDDWFDQDDKVCGTGSKALRLSPVQQQKVGATYIAAAARLFVKGDDRVLPLLDGSGVRAPSAGPARVLSHAVGAARTPFVQPAAGLKVTGAGATKARLCREVTQGRSACIRPENFVTVPHFVSFFGLAEQPDRYAVDLKWSKPGGGAKLQPGRPVSLRAAKSVAVRIIVPANSPTRKFDVAIADSAGRKATLGRVSLAGLPGTGQTVGAWGQEVRVPLTAARRAGLDLRRVSRLQVIPRSRSGHAWLLDAWGWQPGTPAVQVADRARIDVGTLGTVPEQDAPSTHRMPVSVSGNGSGKVRIITTDQNTGRSTGRVVTVHPGTRHLEVPLRVAGDTKYGSDAYYTVLAEAVQGTVVGDFIGSVEVTEDDPAPRITVTPVDDRVTEGTPLKWQLRLSEPAAVELFLELVLLPPVAGTELSTTDLPANWLRNNLGVEPRPSRPLSSTEAALQVFVPPGDLRVNLTTPTVADRLPERAERIRYRMNPIDGSGTAAEVTGTVTDSVAHRPR